MGSNSCRALYRYKKTSRKGRFFVLVSPTGWSATKAFCKKLLLVPLRSSTNVDRHTPVCLSLVVEPISHGFKFLSRSLPIQKNLPKREVLCIGEPDGIRTHDPLIKSQMLYQLSYGPSHIDACIIHKKRFVNKKIKKI